jgi:FkbH-like protein
MALAQDAAGYAYCASLRDRFGDSGIIGVLVAQRRGGKVEIEDWVLSCRAFGRQVEEAMFDHLLRWTIAGGCNRIETNFAATRKNGLVPEILRRLDFEPAGNSESGPWSCRMPKRPIHAILLETE